MATQIARQLNALFLELRLAAARQCYSEVADLARRESLSYEQYLLAVLQEEQTLRNQKRTARLLRLSGLPQEKDLVGFDRKRLPQHINMQIAALLDGSFLDRSENILVFGNPGSGKTHLVSAIGQALVAQGRKVLFRPTSVLVQELLAVKRDLNLPRYLKKLRKVDALIIDDIGYVQQDHREMEVLFTLLADCYERRSVLLTSNLPFSKWEQIFHDPMTTAAAIDRLVHHSIILELNLPSYRLEHSLRHQTTDPVAGQAPTAKG